MTRREQVLVIGMAAAVLGGLGSLAWDHFKRQGGATRLAGERTELLSFVDGQRGMLRGMRLGPRERLVLDQANGPWAASPFLAEVARERPTEERMTRFVYTGFIQIGSHQFAILNGREYRVADTVQASDFVVEAIQPDHVILVAATGGRRITVDLQTSNAERKTP